MARSSASRLPDKPAKKSLRTTMSKRGWASAAAAAAKRNVTRETDGIGYYLRFESKTRVAVSACGFGPGSGLADERRAGADERSGAEQAVPARGLLPADA